jgi:hypothetical protein
LIVLSQLFFMGAYVVARQVEPDPIVFYSGLRVVMGSALVFFALFWLLSRARPRARSWFDIRLTVPVAVIHVLLGYSFVITVPSLLDRSISIYMIAAVAQSGEQGLTRAELQDAFVRNYVEGNTTVEKRLHEQIVSGHMSEQNGKFRITDKGRFVYELNRTLARAFNLPTRYTEPPP